MSVEKLRRVEDITFEHKGVVHYFKVSYPERRDELHAMRHQLSWAQLQMPPKSISETCRALGPCSEVLRSALE